MKINTKEVVKIEEDKIKKHHAKPALYTYFLQDMRDMAEACGYNLLVHGSLKRDLDLVLVPWGEKLLNVDELIGDYAAILGGAIMDQSQEEASCFPHGRKSYVINLNRGGEWNNYVDEQTYIDISVIPPYPKDYDTLRGMLVVNFASVKEQLPHKIWNGLDEIKDKSTFQMCIEAFRYFMGVEA